MNFFNKKSLKLGFGGAAISGEGGGYGFGKISEKEAIDLLKFSHDKGIRVYDTAPIYGFGVSENRIGKAFHTQEDLFIISKSGVTWNSHRRVDMTNSPKNDAKNARTKPQGFE